MLALAIDDVEHARCAVQRLPLVTAEDLYQPTSAARMGRTYVDFETMTMIGSLDINQQGFGARQAEPVTQFDAR